MPQPRMKAEAAVGVYVMGAWGHGCFARFAAVQDVMPTERGTTCPVSLEGDPTISAAIPVGRWTTYQDVGELVYGHRKAMQAVGDVVGRAGDVDGAHRILRRGGRCLTS